MPIIRPEQLRAMSPEERRIWDEASTKRKEEFFKELERAPVYQRHEWPPSREASKVKGSNEYYQLKAAKYVRDIRNKTDAHPSNKQVIQYLKTKGWKYNELPWDIIQKLDAGIKVKPIRSKKELEAEVGELKKKVKKAKLPEPLSSEEPIEFKKLEKAVKRKKLIKQADELIKDIQSTKIPKPPKMESFEEAYKKYSTMKGKGVSAESIPFLLGMTKLFI